MAFQRILALKSGTFEKLSANRIANHHPQTGRRPAARIRQSIDEKAGTTGPESVEEAISENHLEILPAGARRR